MEISKELIAFVQNNPRNFLDGSKIRIYDAPLIGIAAADDPLFDQFSSTKILGPSFLKPDFWLPGAQSVICYFLPFTRTVRMSNQKPGLPSREWIAARKEGEEFNNAIRRYLTGLLTGQGANAAAPALDSRFNITDRISNWSERHAAFAAGLGTFGLHRALITAKGSAGRIGSVITTLHVEPTKRPYTRFDEYCLYLTRGTCRACMKRCPPAAISNEGKDNAICQSYMYCEYPSGNHPRFSCAKCNISVPCEDRIPVQI